MANFAGITFVAALPPIVVVAGAAVSSHDRVAWAPGTIKSTRISPPGFLHRAQSVSMAHQKIASRRLELRRRSLPFGVEVQVVQLVAVHDALIQSKSSRDAAICTIQLGDVHTEGGDVNGTTSSWRARRANCVDDASVAAGRGISTGAVDVGRSNIDGHIGDNDVRKADRLIGW